MQAVKSDGEKLIQEVEEAIKNAAESGKKMATPKHVKNKDVQSQSLGKFYKWCEEIADTMAGNDFALKPRTELLEKLLINFENGRSASQVAEELFTDKTKLKPEPTKASDEKKSGVCNT